MVEPGDIGTLSWYILLKYLDICIIDKTQDIWPSQNIDDDATWPSSASCICCFPQTLTHHHHTSSIKARYHFVNIEIVIPCKPGADAIMIAWQSWPSWHVISVTSRRHLSQYSQQHPPHCTVGRFWGFCPMGILSNIFSNLSKIFSC